MLDQAIAEVERELAKASDEHRLASTLEQIASARFFGLLDELVTLVRAKKAADERGRASVASKNRPAARHQNHEAK